MKLIILERDGVIDAGADANDWQPLPGSLDAIARLNRAGYRVVVISPPQAADRPDPADLYRLHQRMASAIAEAGGVLDGLYFCPHAADSGCGCRLPAPGLFEEIARRHRIELRGILAVGTSTAFLRAAGAAGADPVLVRSAQGRKAISELGPAAPLMRFNDLRRVVDLLLQDPAKQEAGA
jgi:D-glycero-D-manno-heptose 1,7-bisphosphate phosphatase